MHIIITGSAPRKGEPDLTEAQVQFIRTTLDAGRTDIESISHGVAKGVDSVAGQWASDNHVTYHEYPADWSQGKSAGMKRNNLMLRDSIRKHGLENLILLAFTTKWPLAHSRGTYQCYSEAKRRGLVTHLFRLDTLSKEE